MARPRSETVSLETTPYYHVISKCVRQSYLCGTDNATGISHDHRRSWLEKRLLFLATVFSIDLCAYGIMHNHYHLTLHINIAKSLSFSDKEVIERWHKIYKGTIVSQQYINGDNLSELAIEELGKCCNTWRKRLSDISWFMRCCNETIARMANKEDGCTGHFWNGRFKSIPILDYRALIATMVYNDLNPIKAGVASDVESSDYTSIKKRLNIYTSGNKYPDGLALFEDNTPRPGAHILPFKFTDYLQTVEWTARKYSPVTEQQHERNSPSMVIALGLVTDQWTEAILRFDTNFRSIVGTKENVLNVCKRLNRKWMQGIGSCERCFDSIHQDNNPVMSNMLAEPPINQM